MSKRVGWVNLAATHMESTDQIHAPDQIKPNQTKPQAKRKQKTSRISTKTHLIDGCHTVNLKSHVSWSAFHTIAAVKHTPAQRHPDPLPCS